MAKELKKNQQKQLGNENLNTARVVAEHKAVYRVKDKSGEYLAKISGKQMLLADRREDYPAVGDWVIVRKHNQDQVIIEEILPRQTILKKKQSGQFESQVIAANIDVAFIVESVDRDFNLNRFERYLVIVKDGGITPVIILNKVDLISREKMAFLIQQIHQRLKGVEIIVANIMQKNGLDGLMHYLEDNKTYCFLGSSGVGKSSIINRLLKTEDIKTAEISSSTGRGKHTTTSRQMYFLENGSTVIDNPGTREVGLAVTDSAINNIFCDISRLEKSCKYSDCSHVHESGCAVIQAVSSGQIDEEQYQNYLKLNEESRFFEMSELERRKKDQKFGRFIKKAKEDLKRLEQ